MVKNVNLWHIAIKCQDPEARLELRGSSTHLPAPLGAHLVPEINAFIPQLFPWCLGMFSLKESDPEWVRFPRAPVPAPNTGAELRSRNNPASPF